MKGKIGESPRMLRLFSRLSQNQVYRRHRIFHNVASTTRIIILMLVLLHTSVLHWAIGGITITPQIFFVTAEDDIVDENTKHRKTGDSRNNEIDNNKVLEGKDDTINDDSNIVKEALKLGTKDEQDEGNSDQTKDDIEDGFFDPLSPDPSCSPVSSESKESHPDCWSPPESSIETVHSIIGATSVDGDNDPSTDKETGELQSNKHKDTEKEKKKVSVTIDKHWGSDTNILKMRDRLRNAGHGSSQYSVSEDEYGGGKATSSQKEEEIIFPHEDRRPPIFLMPGLAATRLVSWKFKACSSPLLADVKVQDYAWMNINMLLGMATIDGNCFKECLTLGKNQTDMDDVTIGCKLRPDEGLDAISSLAPGSVSSNLLIGRTNTVYAWLIQWLADNLGYDVSSIIGLPYDWRLSPNMMENRDGFLTLTRKRIEAAVASNGEPGIMVAHSMGNNIFRYFLEWLKNQMHEEAYSRYIRQAERRATAMQNKKKGKVEENIDLMFDLPGWMGGHSHSDHRYNTEDFKKTVSSAKNSVGDRMNTLADSVTSSFNDLWKSISLDQLGPVSAVGGQDSPSTPDNGGRDKEHYNFAKSYTAEKVNRSRKSDKSSQLWELAQVEGDAEWLEWINKHIWTYVGLSAPLLGAINPLRSIISGENMGLPITDEDARLMELSFGSTHTLNSISTKTGFCDNEEFSDGNKNSLACLDELIDGIEKSGNKDKNPWDDFTALENLLKDRTDWDSDVYPISILREKCKENEKEPCKLQQKLNFSALDVQSGEILSTFSKIWREKNDPLIIKLEQLEASWWNKPFPNLLNSTWDRPHIKHVIMAYGVDIPTEIGYTYKKVDVESSQSDNGEEDVHIHPKEKYDGVPQLQTAYLEYPKGKLFEKSHVAEPKSLTETVMMKSKPKLRPLDNSNGGEGQLQHSGDGSVPYLSLSWAHTWLLHATRAMRHSGIHGIQQGERISDNNALKSIKVSHRPKGGSKWVKGGKLIRKEANVKEGKSDEDSDTGTSHPHGTKYKPEMVRFQSKGTSRTTGMEYTTAVIEVIGVEHKETTRNYDILAAVFTEVLKHMHDDLGLV